VQNAWKNGAELSVHGWVYGIKNGVIKDLGTSFSSNEQLAEMNSNVQTGI
jgi:carbonic anhydrase